METKLKNQLLAAQCNEITETHVYNRLAEMSKDLKNKKILKRIGDEELGHYNFWKSFTHEEVKPLRWKVSYHVWMARIFGLRFALKMMESGEKGAQVNYAEIMKEIPEAKALLEDEAQHENELINMLGEQKLQYVGSIVLGLNDALVELTGTLAGLTFAFQNTRMIGMAGLITGIAASFSMAASEYLSHKAEGKAKEAFRSAVYTGMAYILTVILLVLPYAFFESYMFCLILTLCMAVFIIFVFNFYLAVAKDYNFRHRFFEMTAISLGVAGLSFVIGMILRGTIGIEV